jgi:hypothetical protein
MDLKVPDEQMKEIVSTAIMRSLDEKARETLIADAIKYLLTPQPGRGHWDTGRSPLQDMFREAVASCARDMVRDHIKSNCGFSAQVQEVVAQAATKLFTDKDKLVDKVAEAIERGLTERDR